VCFSSFASDDGPHRQQESEEEKKLSRIHPVSWIFGAGAGFIKTSRINILN